LVILVWLFCGATVANCEASELYSGSAQVIAQRVFPREPTRHAVVHRPSLSFSTTQLPTCHVSIPCIIAEKGQRMAHFSKNGSRNMAETCAIDFSYPTSYSTSIPIWGLCHRPPIGIEVTLWAFLLPVLMGAGPDLENFAQNRKSAIFSILITHYRKSRKS